MMSMILLADWSAEFCMDDECEDERMKETTIELASLMSSLNFGSKEYLQWAREENVDAKHNMVELVDLAWDREIHLNLDLDEGPMGRNDVDDHPTPIIKLPQVHKYALS